MQERAYATAARAVAQWAGNQGATNTMGKQIVTEADRQRTPAPRATATFTPRRESTGQKISRERGTATRNKKNPGKRAHKGG